MIGTLLGVLVLFFGGFGLLFLRLDSDRWQTHCYVDFDVSRYGGRLEGGGCLARPFFD